MAPTGGDGLDVPHGIEQYRRVAVRGAPVAQLAELVVTLDPDLSVALERQAMYGTGGDGANPA
jgi:hypothetical protein